MQRCAVLPDRLAAHHTAYIPFMDSRRPRQTSVHGLLTMCSNARAGIAEKVQKPDELVQLVNNQNVVVGTAPRRQMRAENLLHRCSFVLVYNGKGQLYVQKRVAFKETYPSFYDPAPGGVVGAGESYEESAMREIEEEMGVTGVALKPHLDFYYEDAVTRMFGRLFSCVYNGTIRLDPEEVESGCFLDKPDVEELLRTEKVCPDSKMALERFYAEQATL
ncbi:hypothetical protein WJX72_007029 [[Myrmecia] bisecta]|uniref:Nudix hydrolase domain-containing protein n=1 Tax=[Myrmecia] bisecta TaxID=41462 RepID=A0AAW1PUK7_9CHLO